MLGSPHKHKPQKIDQDDRLLEEYLRMKPSRAIDRLLSEYSLEKAFALYHLLQQQKIKRNTTQLRSTLTQKYQNLVDCSNLLSSIKVFTHEIEAIQKNISHVFNQDPQLQQDNANSKKRSVVSVVEEKIYQKRYREAMSMTYTNSDKIDESESLYIPMLRIQILTCLEQEIINRKFTKTFISEIIQCIQDFIIRLNQREIQQIVNNQRKSGEILSLIAEMLQSKQERRAFVENDIIQVIFKCKLLSLHRNKHHHLKEQQNISKFFHDILQLIAENQKESEEISHLSAIFCKNYQQIQAHLLQTFIIKDKDKNISFRYELYERLATSEQFMETLQKLYTVIRQSFSDAPKVTLRDSFLNLWENYYNQLVELLFQRCNPINFLPSLVVDKHKYPKQISKYICSDELSIENRIKSYQTQLDFFFSNINKLLKQTYQLKSSKLNPNDIIEQIITLYSNKIENLNKSNAQFTQTISQQPSLSKLGSLIFLFMFCDEFNSKLHARSQQKQMQVLKKIKAFDLRTNYRITKKFYPCFYDFCKKQSKWSINFDHFFMKYYNPLLKESKREIIKNIIFVLLQGTMQHMDKDKTELFLSQKRAKKQQQSKEQLQRKNKLNDISSNDVRPTTFAKKKAAETVPTVQGES